jgi:hypothetical protein
LSELAYTLELARDLSILPQEEWQRLAELQQKAGAMTWLLYKSMNKERRTVAHP